MKTFIKNRDGKNVCVVVEESKIADKLAFVMHGLGGNKDQAHLRTMAQAFLEVGYTVVTFDTTNTFGESDGNYQDATVTNYYSDLEDVISWASQQEWYKEPFVLCGHSLGGISVLLYAQKYPEKVKALAPISTVVSGKLSLETDGYKQTAEEWKRSGMLVTKSHDGQREYRLKWSHMEDRLKYDTLTNVSKLKMPVLLVVGENDDLTPLLHQQELFEKLPSDKELHVIKEATHSFYEPNEREELKNIFKKWLNKI